MEVAFLSCLIPANGSILHESVQPYFEPGYQHPHKFRESKIIISGVVSLVWRNWESGSGRGSKDSGPVPAT